jgi:hypothetical protein
MRKIGCNFPPKLLLSSCLLATMLLAWDHQQPTVRIEALDLHGSAAMQRQTQAAVIHDYLEAWKSLNGALQENRPELLEEAFVGNAKEKLATTIEEQKQAGIQTAYRDRAHDITLVFHSPDDLSTQLVDQVQYEVEIKDHEKTLVSQPATSRFVAVLTPTEVRWKVRILQAEPQEIP